MRFFGPVGFTRGSIESKPGVYTDVMSVRNYYGDVMKRRLSWESGDSINDDIKIANQISILADEYAEQNAYAMKWVGWKGTKWKVTAVEFERPRMILTLGDVYTEISETKPDITEEEQQP